MALKRYLFWGYTRNSVEEVLSNYESQIQDMEYDLQNQATTIEQLKEELRRAKSEEELIREAIVDAKALSRQIIQEAQQKADSLMSYVEESIGDQLNQVKTNLHYLKDHKQAILSQEEIVREEMRRTLDLYLQLIEKSSQKLSEQSRVFDTGVETIEHGVLKVQNILDFESIKNKSLKINQSQVQVSPISEAKGMQ